MQSSFGERKCDAFNTITIKAMRVLSFEVHGEYEEFSLFIPFILSTTIANNSQIQTFEQGILCFNPKLHTMLSTQLYFKS